MPDLHLPELTFPGVCFGPRETPWDLSPLLYLGGAALRINKVALEIKAGKLGEPLNERIELVRLIHQSLVDYLDGGGRRTTVGSTIEKLRYFFLWADKTPGTVLSLESVERNYRHWCDALLHMVRVKHKIQEVTAHSYGKKVGWLLDRVLERDNRLIRSTRLRKPNASPQAISLKADKQNLEETFIFGHFLLDLADALSIDAIWGPLPLQIPLRNGITLFEWSGLKRTDALKQPNAKYPHQVKYLKRVSEEKRSAWEAEKTFRTRYPLINLRIMVEMFMLMAQPAVNLAQAHLLRMDQWRYKSSNLGYELRTYKHRRWGPVVFEIFSSYRPIFERYLAWRKTIFPDDPDGLLFPLLGKGGLTIERRVDRPPYFDSLKRASARAGVQFIAPQALRSTNVNWMLRRTGDPDLTADEKQHAKRTLLGVYEKPSLHRAMVQSQMYWAKHDPALTASGPGACAGSAPVPAMDTPPSATQPDCITPSGCLFCIHQRDIDSFDHIWSLASFKLLKSFELPAQEMTEGKNGAPSHPADLTIERIMAKLDFMISSSNERADWVKEALLRVEEGSYHPTWAGLIDTHKTNSPDRQSHGAAKS